MPLLQPEIRQDAAPPPFSATFPVSNPNNPSGSMALDSFPQRRKVRVTLAGNLTATHKENGGTRTTTPSGYRSGTSVDCTGRIYVTYAGNQGSYQPECGSSGPFTKDIVVQGQGRVFRDGYGGAGGWRCGTWPYDYCWTFSGSQQVTVEVIDYPGVLNAFDGSTPKTTLPANPNGTNLTFKWTPVPDQSDIPKETYNWWYVATDGTPNGATTPSPGYQEGFGKVYKSGTMYVNVKINGVQKTLSRYIHVGPPTLTLNATPTKVYVGDTAYFSADIKPDTTTVSELRWFWFKPPAIISALRVNTTRTETKPSSNAALLEEPDSVEVMACKGYRTCDYVVPGSGFMRVHATLAGTPKYADRDLDIRHVKITLIAKPKRVIKGKRVYFRAAASTSGGSPAPVGISQWTWQDASGVSTPSCPTGYDTCDMLVYRSGTMRAIGTVNGSIDTAFVSISAFDCDTTGVPEYDDLDMRDSLANFWNRRRAMGPLGKEGAAVITADGEGAFEFTELATASSTACSYTLPLNFPPALQSGILIHPHFETVPPGTTIPLECRPDCIPGIFGAPPECSMGPPDMKSPSTYTDPSDADWQYHDYRKDFPERAGTISKDGVSVSERTSDRSQWNDDNPSRKRFDRSDWGSCAAHPI